MAIIFKLLVLSLMSFSQESSKIWTQASFAQYCKSKSGKIERPKLEDRIRLECLVQGDEIQSVWFNRSGKMLGSLSRTRDENGLVTLDQEYDPNGELAQVSYYLHTTSSTAEQAKNMFVFDRNKTLVRGNIQIGNSHYVLVNQNMIFLDGRPSHLGQLQKALGQKFNVPKGSSLNQQIVEIWTKQNSSHVGTPAQNSGAATK